ncbi:hypothetical protein L0P16_16725, partial [Faecalibacillus intestinalis]
KVNIGNNIPPGVLGAKLISENMYLEAKRIIAIFIVTPLENKLFIMSSPPPSTCGKNIPNKIANINEIIIL